MFSTKIGLRLRRLPLALLAALCCAPVLAQDASSDTGHAPCQLYAHDGTEYLLCTAKVQDAPEKELRTFYADQAGRIFSDFATLRDSLPPDETLLFAVNAGMFHDDLSPVGLYIERETTIGALTHGGNYGNFGMQPNGVFCIAERGFSIHTYNAFKAAPPQCDYATQSGPMLLIKGKLHPRFIAGSRSTRIRNGVGVSPDGQSAYFLLSNARVNFHDFAEAFRALGVEDALYLDGSISAAYYPELGYGNGFWPIGPMIGLIARRADHEAQQEPKE